MSITHDYAILAPLPIMHLREGIEICDREGEVAFGSNHWEFFGDVEQKRTGQEVEVFIYPNMGAKSQSEVSWHAVYVRSVRAVGKGRHPQGNRFRPPCTYEGSNEEWVIFWHIRRLCLLNSPIPLNALQGYKQKANQASVGIPRSPMLIEYPKDGPRLV